MCADRFVGGDLSKKTKFLQVTLPRLETVSAAKKYAGLYILTKREYYT
jgi:hypothetical protein